MSWLLRSKIVLKVFLHFAHRLWIPFENHKASIHDGVRYKCTHCRKQFTQKFQLKVHISSVHLGKKVQCERCDDQAGAGSALRAHIAAVHKGIRYKCDICGQTFRNKGAIKSHKSSKHDKKSLINYSTEDNWEYLVLFLWETRRDGFKASVKVSLNPKCS